MATPAGVESLPPDIHLVIDGEHVGPLGSEELTRLRGEGKIAPGALAWHPALDDWAQIAALPELAWLIAPDVSAQAAPSPILAAFAPRLAAGAVDLALWLAVATAAGAAIVFGAPEPTALGLRFDVIAQLAAALYFIGFMSRIGGGATLGYRLFHLKLVDQRDLTPPALPRAIVWYITSYVRLLGCLTFFIDSKHRMLHNLASGTLVIVDRGPVA